MTSEKIEVALQLERFSQGRSGAITGPIWLQCGAIQFPCAAWSDFPVVILGWWLENVASLRRGEHEASCMFMDGPYEFIVTNRPHDLVHMQLIDRDVEGSSPVSELSVPFVALQVALWTAANTVVAECVRRGWKSRDVNTLRASLSTLGH